MIRENHFFFWRLKLPCILGLHIWVLNLEIESKRLFVQSCFWIQIHQNIFLLQIFFSLPPIYKIKKIVVSLCWLQWLNDAVDRMFFQNHSYHIIMWWPIRWWKLHFILCFLTIDSTWAVSIPIVKLFEDITYTNVIRFYLKKKYV